MFDLIYVGAQNGEEKKWQTPGKSTRRRQKVQATAAEIKVKGQ